MDFQALVNASGMAAAVLSVEKTNDFRDYGDIRIVCANESYKKIMGPAYRDNMIYSELLPKEPNFEDFCYRCAVKKLHLHAYVDTKSMGLWTDGTYIPLSADVDTENLSYFLFFFEFTHAPESERMADVSMEIAPLVIQTCINLRGSEDFANTMSTVISDIQKNTDSFCSCIILMDKQKQKYSPLCASFKDPKIFSKFCTN